MLELCKTSVANQSTPVEHVIVEDTVGLGVGGMYQDIRHHAFKVTGEYVMVLSDDNILTDPHFALDLEKIAWEHDRPDVIVFKGVTGNTVQPAHWGEPIETKIDLSCFAVAHDLWVEYADRWGDRYEGDFDFVRALWDDGYEFCWWDRLAFKALQISAGRPE